MLYSRSVLLPLLYFVFPLALGNEFQAAETRRSLMEEGQAPKPTQQPNAHELRDVTQKTLLAASDNTCGFFGGSSDKPWGCSASSTCVFATAIPVVTALTSTSIFTSLSIAVNSTGNFTITETHTQTKTDILASTTTIAPTTAGSVICCNSADGCPIAAATACVDRGKYDYDKTCTSSCPDDPMTLKCTSGIYLYCATLLFPTPSISALYCDYLSTYPASPLIASTSASFAQTVVSHFHTTPTSVLPMTSSTATGKSTASAVPKSSKGGGNKGPIIGGVVGGLAAVAILVGVLVFVLRKRKSAAATAEPTKESPVGSQVGKEGEMVSVVEK